jgi:hypothetical protein
MKARTLSGLIAVAGLLLIAAPGGGAQAASLISPGIAAAVQDSSIVGNTTEVHWRRHHRWHRHHWRHRHHHHHPHHWRRW